MADSMMISSTPSSSPRLEPLSLPSSSASASASASASTLEPSPMDKFELESDDPNISNSPSTTRSISDSNPSSSSASSSSSSSSSFSSPSSSSTSSSSTSPSSPPQLSKSGSSSSSAASSASGLVRTSSLRLQSDLRHLENDTPEGVSASPLDADNLYLWRACIFGPTDTPWEGGVFQLQLQFSKEYPQKPPVVKFISKLYHPNVFSDGTLCLDIIQDQWSPVFSVSTILTSIQSLLTDPNPASPANPEAAKLYQSDKKAYNKKVRACVAKCTGM